MLEERTSSGPKNILVEFVVGSAFSTG